jgi:hypothetical protein
MPDQLKTIVSTYRRVMRRLRSRSKGIYSYGDEQILIAKYLKELKVESRQCVDIAASDGVTMSNTYSLFRQGWGGLAVEYDAHTFARLAHTYRKFQDVNLAKCKVTPLNVMSLLKANAMPEKFGFLNLDIDGYDYFVLEQLLREFRPSLICVEINEKIPPPVKFTVKWDPNYFWTSGNFYGQSISQLYTLCPLFGYSLVELYYNNAFLVPSEIKLFPNLTPEEAYQKGYRNQPDRLERFPWNANLEPLLSLPPEAAVDFINRYFSDRKDQFICTL